MTLTAVDALVWRDSVVEMPSAAQITAALATVGIIGQYFGVVLPTSQTSEANRDANWSAREQLMQCHEERDKLLDKLLEVQ